MATGASYFSGTTLLPSQRATTSYTAAPVNAAAASAPSPSPSKSRDPRFSGCVPVTIRHIARSFAAAADSGGDPVLSIDGVETSNVRVLGRVVNMVNRETDVSFTLDDGTGKIALVRWITEQPDAREAAYVQNGAYIKVYVNLVGFQAKKQGIAFSIRPITNFNDVALHFIECMHVHLENVRPKMQGQLPPAVQTSTSTHAPFSGGIREHQIHFTPQVNQMQGQLSAVQTNTFTYAPFSGGVREHQVQFTPQVNQFSAYSGIGAQQHDLQRMVLEVLQDPDILALENGVHINEVVKRLGMPKANIMEVIRYLVDVGFIYSTIDDDHVKSTCNG